MKKINFGSVNQNNNVNNVAKGNNDASMMNDGGYVRRNDEWATTSNFTNTDHAAGTLTSAVRY